ncbi:MAG TPA: hypothetical protein VNS29_04070 [Burkholderiaceae bacterium]|nr:hypothetical protein [Burkholderiaceae bacterium]
MSYVLDRDGLAACPDDPARVADFIEPTPTSPTDMLNVLADRYQYTNDGRNAAQLATILIDNDFLVDLPFPALLEILRHVARNSSTDWRYTRGHLVNILEEIGGES